MILQTGGSALGTISTQVEFHIIRLSQGIIEADDTDLPSLGADQPDLNGRDFFIHAILFLDCDSLFLRITVTCSMAPAFNLPVSVRVQQKRLMLAHLSPSRHGYGLQRSHFPARALPIINW